MQFASKYLRPAGLSTRLRSSASGRLFFSSLSLQELPRPISSHRLTNLSVEFLGTGSFSTRYRFSSAVSLHLERKDTWLFDAPDGTLRQTNLIADRNFCHVQKIFISSFVTDTFHGLPNLIIGRLMSALQSKIAKKPIDVYGPPGLVKYLNATLPLSVRPEFHSHFSLLTVHELVLDDELISDLDKHQRMQFKWAEEYANRLQQRAFKGAADESVEPSLFNTRQIHRDPTTNTWILAEEEKATLVAGLVGAAQPVFGFVFQEHDYCDKISADMVSDLKDKYVLNVDDLQRVKAGETIEVRRRGGDPTQLESVSLETLNLHRHEGRKVVIVTAGSDATTLAGIGADCDVLVHPLSIRDDRQQDALDHSMATPTMCVQAAAAMRAHRLVPTRLSSHQSEEITDAMNLWTSKCDRVAGHLYFAKDGLLVNVPREGYHRDDLHKGLEVEFPLFSQFRATDTSHRRPTRYEGQATINNIPPRNRGLMSHGNAIVNMLADHTFAPDEPAPAARREHTQSAAAQSRPLKPNPKLQRGPPASGGDVARRKHTNSSAAAGASAASS